MGSDVKQAGSTDVRQFIQSLEQAQQPAAEAIRQAHALLREGGLPEAEMDALWARLKAVQKKLNLSPRMMSQELTPMVAQQSRGVGLRDAGLLRQRLVPERQGPEGMTMAAGQEEQQYEAQAKQAQQAQWAEFHERYKAGDRDPVAVPERIEQTAAAGAEQQRYELEAKNQAWNQFLEYMQRWESGDHQPVRVPERAEQTAAAGAEQQRYEAEEKQRGWNTFVEFMTGAKSELSPMSVASLLAQIRSGEGQGGPD